MARRFETAEDLGTASVLAALGMGNPELAKNWVPDASLASIIARSTDQNYLAAFANKLAHKAEADVSWLILAAVNGYLNNPSYVREGEDFVSHPIFSGIEVEKCINALYQAAKADAEAEFTRLINYYLSGAQVGHDNYEHINSYRAMWPVDGVTEIPQMLPSLESVKDPIWFSYVEEPESYKHSGASEKAVSPIMGGYSQGADVLTEKSRMYDRRNQYDKSPQGQKIKENDVAAYAKYLEEEAKRTAQCARDRLVPVEGDDYAFTVHSGESDVFKALDERLAAYQSALGNAATALSAGNSALEIEFITKASNIAREAWTFLLSEVGHRAKLKPRARLYAQLSDLHRNYRLSPAQKLDGLVGSVECLQDSAVGTRDAFPITTAAELRHFVAFLDQCMADVYRPIVANEVNRKELRYVNANGQSVVLSQREKDELVEGIIRQIVRKIKPRFDELNRLDISKTRQDRLREPLQWLCLGLEGQLEPVDTDRAQNIEMQPESLGDLMAKPVKLVHRYERAYRVWSGIRKRMTATEERTASARQQRENELEGNDWDDRNQVLNDGIVDHGLLLHKAISQAHNNGNLSFYAHLLKQSAAASYKRRDATAVAVAYRKVVMTSAGAKDRCWKLFSLLRICEELFESDKNANWLSDKADQVLSLLACKNPERLTLYQSRDKAIVQQIIKRLVIDLCLGEINERTISESPEFGELLRLWGYLEVEVPTLQGKGADSDILIKMREFRGALLPILQGFFTDEVYPNLQGVKLLAIDDNEDRLAEVTNDQKELYNAAVADLNSTLAVQDHVGDLLRSNLSAAIENKALKERLAESNQRIGALQQKLSSVKHEVREEMQASISSQVAEAVRLAMAAVRQQADQPVAKDAVVQVDSGKAEKGRGVVTHLSVLNSAKQKRDIDGVLQVEKTAVERTRQRSVSLN